MSLQTNNNLPINRMANIPNVQQQRKDAPGKLYDIGGNSSVGELPRGEMRIKQSPTIITTASRNISFPIGSESLLPGQANPMMANPAGHRAKYLEAVYESANPNAKFAHPTHLANPDKAVDSARDPTMKHVGSTPNLPEVPASNGFLNQGIMNPVRAGNYRTMERAPMKNGV
jgi:hypothetical protein